jgi:hypothetical protein
MPFKSDASHYKPYADPPAFQLRLASVKKLITTLLNLDIDLPLKKRMLVHAVWELTNLSGGFKGRYRSKGVLEGHGALIQRDHVYQKRGIVERLINDSTQIDDILQDVVHCVVTKEEHDRLTEYSRTNPSVDGWERYRGAGIEVIDMLTNTEVAS